MTSSLVHARANAFQVMSRTIAVGHGATFDVYDVATEAQWVEIVQSGHAVDVLAGAIAGAVESLHRFGATTADVLSCPTVTPGSPVTEDDMRLAIGWVASALFTDSTRDRTLGGVFGVLWDSGWWADPVRVTSLMIAIAVAAGHGADYDRG
jgi:hypothetical protein